MRDVGAVECRIDDPILEATSASSTVSPSAAVGWVKSASRSSVNGSRPSMAVCHDCHQFAGFGTKGREPQDAIAVRVDEHLHEATWL